MKPILLSSGATRSHVVQAVRALSLDVRAAFFVTGGIGMARRWIVRYKPILAIVGAGGGGIPAEVAAPGGPGSRA